MAGYSRQQLDTIRRITSTPSYKAASPRERKAALEAALVESNATPIRGGDRDSSGVYQQRPSQGWGSASDSVETDTSQFLAAAHQANTQGGSAGQLAARVQRPARQYIGRYDQRSSEADKLLGHAPQKSVVSAASGNTVKLEPGHTTVDTKGAVVAALLDPRKKMSLASRIVGNVSSGDYTTTTKPKVTTTKGYGVAAAARAPKAADTITNAKPGSPTASGTSEGGVHATAGLAGFPAHDYFAPSGSRAVAPVSGTVVRLSGHDPAAGPTQGPHGPLGWSVYIKGDDGRTYFMTHMGSRNVKVGQRLKQGQAIGTVADYAKYGTPSHIHLGVSGG